MSILSKIKEIIEGTEYEGKVFLSGESARDFLIGNPITSETSLSLSIDFGNGGLCFSNWLKYHYPNYCDCLDTTDNIVVLRFDTNTLICGPKKDTLSSQNFYCDSLFYNITSGDIEDPTYKGLEDCYNKVLRYCDDKLNDYTLLKAIRLKHVDGFKLSTKVADWLKKYNVLIETNVLRQEFCKILMSATPVQGIKDLREFGILSNISPELCSAWEFNQNSKYHSMNLTDHLFSVLDLVSKSEYGNDLRLRLAALFHDISKYKDYTWDGNQMHFKGHEITSSELTEMILSKLKFEKSIISDVKTLIRNHMWLKQSYNKKDDIFQGSDKLMRKFYRSLGDLAELELELIDADNKSHDPKYNMPGQIQSFRDRWEKLNTKIENDLKIDGKRIIDYLGVAPGKSVGDIKQKLVELVDEYPDLKEDDLLSKYKELYGDKKIYIAKSNEPYIQQDTIYTSLIDLKYDSRLYIWIPEVFDSSYHTLELRSKDPRFKNIEGKVEVSAIEFPFLYDKLWKDHQVREIIDKVSKELHNLSFLDGFKKIKISKGSDFIATIDWDDSTVTEIL